MATIIGLVVVAAIGFVNMERSGVSVKGDVTVGS
jgi:hypothetical protein